MATKYLVCNNRSVCLPNNTLLKQGQAVPAGVKKKLIEEWLRTGFIFQAGQDPNPKSEAPPVVPSDGALGKAKQNSTPTIVPPAQPVQTNGKFNHDPEELKGKSLEELNLLLADLDTDPADTEEEAIGLLSSDFKS